MATQVQIVNQALTKLGAQRITAMTDPSNSAAVMLAIYDAKRDAELAANPWSFAIKRVQIPASSTAPAFGWSYSYPLPTDYLAMVEVGENFVFYETDTGALFGLESDPDTSRIAVLTDQASPLSVRYIYKVTNPGLHPVLFNEALACRLAAEACEQLTQNLSKRQQAWDEYKQAVRLARRMNAIEKPPQQTPASSWVRALDGTGSL